MSGKVWFTSDTHFNQFISIHFFSRPFSSITKLNTTLIQNWNNAVAPDDVVYHLGDFGKGSIRKRQNIFKELHGSKYLIRGNHERYGTEQLPWKAVSDEMKLDLEGVKLILSHRPIPLKKLKEKFPGVWNIHGHLHGHGWNKIILPRIDLSSDCWDFTPVSFDALKAIIIRVSEGESVSTPSRHKKVTWLGKALRYGYTKKQPALKYWRKFT